VPAYLSTADRVSAKFNAPITAANAPALDIGPTDVPVLFEPMVSWGNSLTNIDYRTLTQAVVPGWIISIENALQAVGVNVSVPDIARALLDPVVRPIREIIQVRVVGEAQRYLENFTKEYRARAPSAKEQYERVLRDAAPGGQSESLMDRPLDSGVYAHAYNLVAATLANHDVMLPKDWNNATTDGPASFDTS
jgi:hypothetical protein